MIYSGTIQGKFLFKALHYNSKCNNIPNDKYYKLKILYAIGSIFQIAGWHTSVWTDSKASISCIASVREQNHKHKNHM